MSRLSFMSLSFLICKMETRTEGCCEEVMRSGVLAKAALHHGGVLTEAERGRLYVTAGHLLAHPGPQWSHS